MLLVKLKNFFFSTALLDLSSITRNVIVLASMILPHRRFVTEIRNLRKLGSLRSLVEPALSLSPSHARAQISARRVCSHRLLGN